MPNPLPHTSPVQFSAARGSFEVTRVVDPSGAPVEVLDTDDGFAFVGTVTLPGWLSGRGLVKLAADQIGGPFDAIIGQVEIAIQGASTPTDPPNLRYAWTVAVRPNTLPDKSEMYQLGIVFAFKTNAGGHTDIGGFYDLGAYLVV